MRRQLGMRWVLLAAVLLLLGAGSGLASAHNGDDEGHDDQTEEASSGHSSSDEAAASDAHDDGHDDAAASDDSHDDAAATDDHDDDAAAEADHHPSTTVDGQPACSDGHDNDQDGDVDGDDDGCDNAEDNSESTEGHHDGDHDDEDADEHEEDAQCSDGHDNDDDGLIDFGTGPNNDPGCTSADDDFEITDNAHPDPDPEVDPECSDGDDNDDDGDTDYPADPGCDNPDDNTESSDAALQVTKNINDPGAAPDAEYNFVIRLDCPGQAHDAILTFTTTATQTVEELHDGAQCIITEDDPGDGWSTTVDADNDTASPTEGRSLIITVDGTNGGSSEVTFVNTAAGAAAACGADDPNVIAGIGQALYDGGLTALGNDPGDPFGAVTGGLYPAAAPVTGEVACLVSLVPGV